MPLSLFTLRRLAIFLFYCVTYFFVCKILQHKITYMYCNINKTVLYYKHKISNKIRSTTMNKISFKFKTIEAIVIGLALDIVALLAAILIYGVIL